MSEKCVNCGRGERVTERLLCQSCIDSFPTHGMPFRVEDMEEAFKKVMSFGVMIPPPSRERDE